MNKLQEKRYAKILEGLQQFEHQKDKIQGNQIQK